MSGRGARARRNGAAALLAALLSLSPAASAQQIDSGVIRLAAPPTAAAPGESRVSGDGDDLLGRGERRGFDYQSFGARVESLWFQRKAHLAEGRGDDALRQAELIRSFVAEEGVRRLEAPAGALLLEADRLLREGNHGQALASLHLAEGIDPGRPQIRLLRASVLRASGAGAFASLAEWVRALRSSASTFLADPAQLQPFALVLLVAFLVSAALFSSLMVIRYQSPIRHDVEEWLSARGRAEWATPAGWAVLLLPLLTWIGAGWIFFYWIVVAFRYMKRSEKSLTILLLVGTACCTPLYRASVGLYGKTADPRIRTTFSAANGEYDPELIVRLRELVESHPDDATYRFLLGGLYKDGRFFEEAFEEYRRVLALSPVTWQAHVNIGNLFFQMGQYGEAIAQYRRALEVEPGAVIAIMNTYHAQTESFRLNEAAQTLEMARRVDAEQVARMLSTSRAGNAAGAADATLDLSAVWGTMLAASRPRSPDADSAPPGGGRGLLRRAASPAALFAFLAAALALASTLVGRAPARRCSRCGRAFCSRCKSGRDAPEYCTHCVHLFVLGAGLAPETRSRKLYEIESHEKRRRILRALSSALLPGAGEVLSGRVFRGTLLSLGWVAALLTVAPAAFGVVESSLGLDLRLDVIGSGAVPPGSYLPPSSLVAVPALLLVWSVSNFRRFLRRGEA